MRQTVAKSFGPYERPSTAGNVLFQPGCQRARYSRRAQNWPLFRFDRSSLTRLVYMMTGLSKIPCCDANHGTSGQIVGSFGRGSVKFLA